MALWIANRTVLVGLVIMQQTQTPEETMLFILLIKLGILAILLTFAYMVYGQEEE
jgi:hypothetical protein